MAPSTVGLRPGEPWLTSVDLDWVSARAKGVEAEAKGPSVSPVHKIEVRRKMLSKWGNKQPSVNYGHCYEDDKEAMDNSLKAPWKGLLWFQEQLPSKYTGYQQIIAGERLGKYR